MDPFEQHGCPRQQRVIDEIERAGDDHIIGGADNTGIAFDFFTANPRSGP
jgi:hypothetical protein